MGGRDDIGPTLDAVEPEHVVTRFQEVSPAVLRRWQENMRALPSSVFACTDEASSLHAAMRELVSQDGIIAHEAGSAKSVRRPTVITEAPAPLVMPGTVLINSTQSLISAGTERMLVDFGNAYLIPGNSRKKRKWCWRKWPPTAWRPRWTRWLQARRATAAGLCNVGVVAAVGAGVTDLKPGDRVASNGPHADVVQVGRNLCAPVPDGQR